jgi:hypothetical protein
MSADRSAHVHAALRPRSNPKIGFIACYAIYVDYDGVERRCRRPEGHSGPHVGPPRKIVYAAD